MTLSPLDIKKKRFRRVIRGCDETEVTSFLEQIAEELEVFLSAQRESVQRFSEMEMRLAQYSQLEKNIQLALVQAQDAAAKTVESANRESQVKIRETELTAQKILDDARRDSEKMIATYRTEAAKLADDMNSLRAMRTNLVARIKSFITSQAQALITFDSDELNPSGDTQTPDFLNSSIDDILKNLE